MVAAGGLSPDRTQWVGPRRRDFFLPVGVLSKVFRGKFVAAIEQAFVAGELHFYGQLQTLAQPKLFRGFLRQLFSKCWVVYCKPPFGGPDQVLRYLGVYTHRVAISNHRLVSLVDDKVTFRWRDSAHKNKKRLMTLPAVEFLRRFLLHVLPHRFVRIRHLWFSCWPTPRHTPAALQIATGDGHSHSHITAIIRSVCDCSLMDLSALWRHHDRDRAPHGNTVTAPFSAPR